MEDRHNHLNQPVPCEALVRVQEKQKMFEWWQKEQNGTLKDIKRTLLALDKKVDDKIDGLANKIDAKSEAARVPATETGLWIRNALLSVVMFLMGLLASAVVRP